MPCPHLRTRFSARTRAGTPHPFPAPPRGEGSVLWKAAECRNDQPLRPSLASLPEVVPIFPLTGVLLLPRGRLPLNIFEPRYLAMTRDALTAPARHAA